MKKFVTLLVILVMSLSAVMAQSAAKLNYQAVVRSSDNHLASNETVNVTIDIKVGGSTVYTETHSGVNTNINGLLNLVIGEASTPHSGDFSAIDWANATIDATIVWGSNTVTTSNPVNAVPFALSTDCSSVVACVDDAIGDGGSTTNNAIDTIINNHLAEYEIKNCEDVNACVETKLGDNTSNINNAVDTIVENHLTPYEIKNCNDVSACVETKLGDNTSNINNAVDTIVENHLTPYQIKNCGDVTDCVNSAIADGSSVTNHAIDTLVENHINNSTITFHQEGATDQTITLNQSTDQTITIVTPMQKSARFVATAGQTAFSLTVPSGKTLDATNYLVQMYINGVYVGDNTDGVLTISGNTATYVPAENGNYALVAGDRIKLVYWVK